MSRQRAPRTGEQALADAVRSVGVAGAGVSPVVGPMPQVTRAQMLKMAGEVRNTGGGVSPGQSYTVAGASTSIPSDPGALVPMAWTGAGNDTAGAVSFDATYGEFTLATAGYYSAIAAVSVNGAVAGDTYKVELTPTMLFADWQSTADVSVTPAGGTFYVTAVLPMMWYSAGRTINFGCRVATSSSSLLSVNFRVNRLF